MCHALFDIHPSGNCIIACRKTHILIGGPARCDGSIPKVRGRLCRNIGHRNLQIPNPRGGHVRRGESTWAGTVSQLAQEWWVNMGRNLQ